MQAYQRDTALTASWWRSTPAASAGAVLVVAAAVVLIDVAVVAYFSAKLIGWAAVVAGGVEIVTALLRRPWMRSAPRAVLGLFYMAFGFAFLEHSEFRTLVLMYVLAFSLVASGVVRLALGLGRRRASAWFLLSGGVGVAAGLAMLLNWVETNDRAIGLLLGVDLLLHGVAWLMRARGARGFVDDYETA